MTLVDSAATAPADVVPAMRTATATDVRPGTGIDGAPAGDVLMASPMSSILRGALLLLSTQPLTWAMSLATTILLPRYLGGSGLGGFAVAYSIAGLVAMVGTLGVPDYLARRIATQPSTLQRESGAALLLLVGLTSLLALLVGVLLPLTGFALPGAIVLRIALAGTVISVAQGLMLALLRGRERHGWFAWLNAASTVLGGGIGLVVLVAGGGVTGYLAAGVAVSALVLALSWRRSGCRLERASLDFRLWRRIAAGGLPFLTMVVLTNVYASIDSILLAALSRDVVIGWYSAAYRLLNIPMFIPAAITTPLLPALSRAVNDPLTFRRTLRQSFAAVLICNAPISMLLIVLAPAVPDLLRWPAEFHHSIVLIMILVVQLPVVAVDMVLAAGVFALHRERQWLKVAMVAAIFNPAANLLLIPLFEHSLHNGAIGASIITVATELVMFVGGLIVLPKGSLSRETAIISGKVVVAALALACVTLAVRPVSLPLAVVLGGTVYGLAGFVLGIVRPSTVRGVIRLGFQSLLSRSRAAA